jgi:hypothetical protein
MLGLGLLGIAGLLPQAIGLSGTASLPAELAALPRAAVVALSLLNPLLLTLAGAAVGAALAHRVGLRSALAGTSPAGALAGLPLALLVGSALAVLLQLVDWAWKPWLGAQAEVLRSQAQGPGRLLTGILYGGLTEEIITRWGLLSLLAWGIHRMFGRRHAQAPTWAMLLAILFAALAFALAHLPALAAVMELTPAWVARTLALNLLAGLAYGWLFWRHHLEAAMAAHAATHVGFWLLGLVF